MKARLLDLLVLCSLASLGALLFVPVASGSIAGCRVANKSTRQSYADLQSAVNAAFAGDTLTVQGTCTGTASITTDLTLIGQRRGSSLPTLDGGGSGTVLTIDDDASVAIRSLTITGGDGTAGDAGGGITVNAGGTVTLTHGAISGNTAGFGGGIENNSGTVVVNDSTITQNTATVDGGGIDTYPAGTVSVRGDTSIDDNTAELNGGGVSDFDFGTMTVGGSSNISDNTADGSGGGVYDGCDVTDAACSGSLTLRDAGSIHNNTAGVNGGGISNGGGTHDQPGLTVTMSDGSTVHNNTAGNDGGGIFNNNGTLNGAVPQVNVYGNAPDDIS